MNFKSNTFITRLVVLAVVLLTLTAVLAPAVAATEGLPPGGKVLARGAAIHGANGIMFDANDQLHIASVAGREIVVMEPNTGKIVARLGTEVGVEGPDDLAFGPDGSLYFTSILTGLVGRLAPDGVFTGQFVAPGVNPITFSDDGRLFVALDFLGDGLYELDPELVNPPRPIVVATAGNPMPLGFLNGMDWGPDGRLYGPIWTQGRIISIDVDSCNNTNDPWADCDIEEVAGGLGIPAAVKFDSTGQLHTIDQISGQVLHVDAVTGDTQVIAQLTPGLDNLAFDSNDQLFVSHAQDGTIFRILPSGVSRTLNKSGMILPGGVAVLPGLEGRESVYVADLFTLREFDGRTGRPMGLDRNILGATELIPPFTVAADGDNLVLTSWFDSAVQIWDPDAGAAVMTYHNVPVPLNAIGFDGDVVIAQLLTGSVVRASDNFTLADGLFVPAGLAATEEDLWVGDWATGIVWQIVSEGLPLTEPIPVATGLSFPEGLAVDMDGDLVVVESGTGRLSHIDLTTGAVSTLADGLDLGSPGIPGAPPTWVFNGVAVGESGAIYVSGEISNVIYRFHPNHNEP
jgi:sugar lactone lactonase YvrE